MHLWWAVQREDPSVNILPSFGRYVAPEQVKPPQSTTVEPTPPQLLHGDTGTLPQVRPSHFWGCPGGIPSPDLAVPPQPRPATHRPPQPARKASTDLLADIGGDPFASPAPGPAFAAFPGELGGFQGALGGLGGSWSWSMGVCWGPGDQL